MKILVIGNGGREHVLAWKFSQSPKKPRVYCAPGNAGIAGQARLVPIAATDVAGLLKFALSEEIDLTVVGSEAPLALGIVDAFKKNHLKIFGPQQEAARLESSKVFTKEFCRRHKIPQAGYAVFDTFEEAKKRVETSTFPLVIKADGLASGKGVVVAQTKTEALAALEEILVKNRFGSAGRRVVIEEFLKGEEASFIAVCDGNHVLPLASAKDHKRLLDADRGPNTGGMGAFSPSPLVTSDVYEKIMEK
ncbi:MAG: phosphoribosylamine--glycine ligase, partial [bacterium]|nr:phosphoribosylamine--glycine ligase [bacterium]